MQAVLEVAGLQKKYGNQWAVRDATFEVREGEIFGILGNNGAGKTTTVECLQGLRDADAGMMRVLGEDPRTRSAQLRGRVGSQLQDAALPERIRVSEALQLFSSANRDQQEISELMATWGLSDHASKAFADLSGGLRQRLFIALALLNQPELVFFDELTQGLDPSARREVWQVIEAVRDRGATVILVTHFMEEAERLCDRLVVFDGGRVIAEGSPDHIVATHGTNALMSFTPPSQHFAVERCPGVMKVERVDARLTVEGEPQMVPFVCAALIEAGPPPRDLKITQPDLEDAVLAIHAGVNR